MTIDTDETTAEERRLQLVVLVVLALVVIGSAVDIYMDGPDEWASSHVVMELALMVTSATVGVMLWRAWRRNAAALAVSGAYQKFCV